MARRTSIKIVICLSALQIVYGQGATEESRAYRIVKLSEASARVGPDYRPKLLGEVVRVQGLVQAPVLDAPDASYLALLDAEGKSSGLMLVFSGDNESRKPTGKDIVAGALIEASGIVSLHAGQAVVKPSELKVIGKGSLPDLIRLTPMSAASFQYEGLKVEIQGVVGEFREGSKGDLLDFSEGGQSIRVFLPLMKGGAEHPLAVYQKGDRIRVQGLVSQFCLRPPFNQFFQLLLASPKDIEMVEPRPAVPPQIVPAAVLMVLLVILAAWYLQQRARRQNRVIQRMLQASEELYGAGTAREVAEILRSRLIELVAADAVSTYHYDPSVLHSFHVDECGNAMENGIALAVKNKTLLQFVDTNSADLLQGKEEEAKSLLVIPMRNRNEVRGALVLTGPTGRLLMIEALQPAAQHLANDACQYFEGLEEAAVREQIHRSEKLAVAGQLIHGVLTELNAPLEKIRDLTAALGSSDAAAIHEQVQKASETVKRIVAVAGRSRL
ncbi:MAG: hypothetical protein NTW74_17820, partial [Acidobacteria bacterium]|nr:hypothetical protein [Acidobacteriota bacterium]